ncbi:S-type pyocin domain-containing protein [Pseudomonas sp. DTU12.3]|uniref:S-type pyocin domain-containing protein n=1 Tax=Pseudomonas sp. DTU12.3 TaxID=2073078 RepID=UPI00211539B1|nr:S-type pyocin domain-containing protein [Pseudomonas sp. DTU12.3]
MHIQKDMNMQRPPPFELTEPVHTIGTLPPSMLPTSGTVDHYRHGGTFGTVRSPARYQPILQSFIIPQEREFKSRTEQIPQTIEVELAATRLEESTQPLPPAAAIIRELGVRNKLIQRKNQQLQHQTALSQQFYGSDPTNKSADQFLARANVIDNRLRPDGPGMNLWKQSYRAALEARLLTQTLAVLHQQQISVHQWLAAVQANDHTQNLAAEATRQAAEQARIAVEQQRQRDLQEQVRRQQEQAEIQAREQARLAALAEAQRVAAEQARVAAEAAAQQIVAEKRRLEVLAEQQRQTEADRVRTAQEARQKTEKARIEQQQKADRSAKRKNQKQARRKARAQAQEHAERKRLHAEWQQQTEARWTSPTFANAGAAAAFGPTFAGTLGIIANPATTTAALQTSLRTGVALAVAAASTFAAPFVVGFAALLLPSDLGNGDLYSASVPLAELAPDLAVDLYQLAASGGAVDLPVRLGSRSLGNRVDIVVVSTDGVVVPHTVPVRLARFDAQKNLYVSSAADVGAKGPTVTWTPLVAPLNPSTESPQVEMDLPIYEGAEVTADSGRIDLNPVWDQYGFGGWITVFPIDSGLPPIFTMFRDRRQDSGVVSGMGQAVSSNWLAAAKNPEGAPIPAQIAHKFRGREFSSFRAFRRAFWKAVANDAFLIEQFSRFNKFDIKRGLSPTASGSERIGGKIKLDIHHIEPIFDGGSVYDVDNLRILTPKQHIETHSRMRKLKNEA